MAIEDDVLVVGGGLAGVASALAAAGTGASVRVVSHKESTLRQASGLIDVLGYPPGDGGEGPVVDPFDALADLPGSHPYSLVGESALRRGLAAFDDAVGDAYRGGHTDRNALVATFGGTVKPTARYPAGVAPGLASDDAPALLVGFETRVDFDAPLAADHLAAAGVPFDVAGVTVAFPGGFRPDATVTRLARALDEDESVGGAGARAALADAVAPHVGSRERVGFPAVLGLDRPGAVRADLADRLGAAVFEVPTGPPSLPGMRLSARLDDALDAAGVRVSSGAPVVDREADGGRVERVFVDREGRRVPFAADQYVLATGGLVGGGVESDRESATEPVFGCHVPAPDDRYDWFGDAPFGDHPFARFGVDAGPDLRPRDAAGEVRFDNLRAAGGVLGGFDFASECSGSGVSLATGHAAGTAAGANA
ncbi:MAG: glycerol-3-phosphate dehydrogenase subunit GlpB [Halobacteriaceae archaeon]